MSPRIVFLSIVVGVTLGGAGRLEAASCSDDSDCAVGQFCFASRCLTGSAMICTTHSDCPGGEFCAGGRCLTGCRARCDCPQGQLCFDGECISSDVPAYCCDKPDCPPGRECLTGSNSSSTCAEDPTYVCEDACDCGPAHCCKYDASVQHGVCVKDIDDPWMPGGAEVGPSCVLGVDATYCCNSPRCFAGRASYAVSPGIGAEAFRCFDDVDTEAPSNLCGGAACLFAGDCAPGQTCVDVSDDSTAAPGASCAPEANRCMSKAIAEALFGHAPGDLLDACLTGLMTGTQCEIGWRPGGVYAVQRVVATVGSCGDGTCEAWESAATCGADCQCGDGVCDSTEADSCLPDCGTCGDGACGARETPKICPADCTVTCGDGSCDADEVTGCPQDCGCPDSPTYADAPIWCGDGVCQAVGAIPESCVNCPGDCGAATDSDADQIADCIDNCPLAPNPEQADFDDDGMGNVCDADDDNDGVVDASDACEQTPHATVVGPDGCSVDQTCPCADAWKSHGRYVACVAHASNTLRRLGLIDPAARAMRVSTAARSGCGR